MQKIKSSFQGPSLYEYPINDILNKLHKKASSQLIKSIPVGISMLLDMLFKRKPSIEKQAVRERNLYVPISQDAGYFLYILAISINAKQIVEFGTSFGISTIYLGAAIKDNGSGIVIGTEIEPDKIKIARNNIKSSGLDDYVEIYEGDAQISLKEINNQIDMVLLDGCKELYLPVIKLLQPKIRKGGIVVADDINLFFFKKTLRPYLEYMKNSANGFISIEISNGDGLLLSYKL